MGPGDDAEFRLGFVDYGVPSRFTWFDVSGGLSNIGGTWSRCASVERSRV
jgi:hypothetical protein